MTFTHSQLSFIQSTDPLVVGLAGPGSGKTAALVARIKRQLIFDPSDVETLARDLDRGRRTIAITYTNAAADVLKERVFPFELGYCGTLHGFMLRLLSAHGRLIGFTGELAVISEDERDALLDQIVIEEGYKGSIEALEKEIRIGPAPCFEPGRAQRSGASRVSFRLWQEMLRGSFVDYDSMLGFGVALLNQPGIPWPYEFLFVDEMQDASEIDGQIYAAMRVKERTFIGDPDQSIFSFRGGSPKHLNKLAALYYDAATVFYLEENFRCDESICAAANSLIAKNPLRVAKKTISATGQPGAVEVWKNGDSVQEASRIAKDLLAGGSEKGDSGFPSAAVLVRTNALAEFYRQILLQSGVKVSEKELPKLPADWELARAVLSLQICPESDWLALRYLSLTRGEIVAGRAKIEAARQGITVNELFKLIPPGRGNVFDVMASLDVSKESRALMERISATAGNPLTFSASDLSRKAAEIATAYSVTPGVFVGTLHAAKGQEWDTVYISALEESLLPHKGADLEEERRLAYVGITRARHRLVMSWAAQRHDKWNGLTDQTPSRFLKECGL